MSTRVVRVTLALTTLSVAHSLPAGEITPPGPPGPSMPTLDETRWAAEPRRVIPELPFVITEPGSYVVGGNLVGVAASPGIIVETGDVTIDLNGFTLTGGLSSSDAIRIPSLSPTLERITIRNGALREWGGGGIELRDTRGVHIENILIGDVLGSGIEAGTHATVRDCSVRNAASYGIIVDDGSTVIGCTVDSCQTGISADSGSTVRDCVAANCISTGFSIGGGCSVTGCTARQNLADGFSLFTDTAIIGCVATDNGPGPLVSRGIAANPGCLIRGCVVSNNAGDGILVTGGSTVIGNLCTNNRNTAGDAAGIHASFFGADNRIEDNTLNLNDMGVHIEHGGNLIIANRLTGNIASSSIAAGNAVGPWIDVAGQADLSTVPGADHPWANLEH